MDIKIGNRSALGNKTRQTAGHTEVNRGRGSKG